ncbi:MAG: hypothetical protein R2702_03880 [Acidimicrobiales bacterium]
MIDETFDSSPPPNPELRRRQPGLADGQRRTVSYEFISGICDADTFLIGDIVELLAGGR